MGSQGGGVRGHYTRYAKGNGNWEAAFDAWSAYLLVHLHHYTDKKPQVRTTRMFQSSKHELSTLNCLPQAYSIRALSVDTYSIISMKRLACALPALETEEAFDALHADLDARALAALKRPSGALSAIDIGCGVGPPSHSPHLVTSRLLGCFPLALKETLSRRLRIQVKSGS